MTERAGGPQRPETSPQPGNGTNVPCIPDAISELRTDVRELRKAAFKVCAFLLGAFGGGYLLLSAKFDDINTQLLALSTVIARIDERTSSASKTTEHSEMELASLPQSEAAGTH